MWIERIELSGWRSFSRDSPIVLADCGSVNLLIGPNNVGKSNILRFFHQLARGAVAANLHDHGFNWLVPQRMSLHLSEADVNWIDEVEQVHAKIDYFRCEDVEPVIPGVVDSERFTVQIDAKIGGHGHGDIINPIYRATGKPLLQRVSEIPVEDHVPVTVDGEPMKLSPGKGLSPEQRKFLNGLLRSAFVDSVRIIGPQRAVDSGANDTSKVNLIPSAIATELYQVKNAEPRRWSKISHDIEAWLARLLGCEAPQVDFLEGGPNSPVVSFGLDRHNGRKPPLIRLDAVGTGVAEFFTILAFLRLRSDEQPMALFVDEIEAHLHPSAVRELVLIIRENFPNIQLFIATHSTDLLDAMEEDWRLYRFSMPKAWATQVELVSAKEDQLEVITDLGYRPTQLFLANAVIFVEGPSDVLYIQALLRQIDRSLVEGRDYTFLLYGGSNVRHVSYIDQGESLVKLLDCVHFPVVVCDRDRSDDDPLKNAVEFLREQAKLYGRDVIITPGYEIESIVSPAAMAVAVSEIMGNAKKHRGTIDASKLDFEEPLRTALAKAITPSDGARTDALAIATNLAKHHKVEIARGVIHRDGAFSEQGLYFGKQIVSVLQRATNRS
jgi:hypothetical protein